MHRIPLGNATFEGRNNAYLLSNSKNVLIDTGIATDDVHDDLERELADCGLTFSDIDAVFLTHYHADHSGLAGTVQAASDATVYIHEADSPLVGPIDGDAWQRLRDVQRRKFDEWGMPEAKQTELLESRDTRPDTYGAEIEVETFRDGDVFAFDEYELEVLHTPGHTAGLSCFVYDGDSLFSGDALLPKYTPNVGGADVRVDAPLEQYVESLDRLVDGDYDVAWPGHRAPIDDPTSRARTIRRHHEERAWNVLSVLDEIGPADPWTVSARLFGELESIHILHGPGEASAHLEHLVATDDVVRVDGEYDITAAAADALADRDDGHWEL